MLKVTQLSGHRGAKCSSRWAATSSPVPSVLPTGLCIRIFSSPLFPSFPPPRPSPCLSALPLSGFPPAPSSASLSAPLSHFLCLPCMPTLLSQSRLLWGHPQDSGHSEVPGDSRSPAVPLCPSALGLRQEGWAKGRGRRPQQPKL